MTTTDRSDSRWTAVLERRPRAADPFFYAVTTTGVFCRPTCGAKRPLRSNVTFFDDARAAQNAGFRPCKRCHPTGPNPTNDLVLRAIGLIEEASAPPTGDELAAGLAVSVATLRRAFQTALGLTPRQYAEHVRRRRLAARLGAGESVSEAQFAAGYGSSSRLYEATDRELGMTPAQFRRGGPDQEIVFETGDGPLGWVLAAMTERGVCHLALGPEEDNLVQELRRRFPHAKRGGADAKATLRQALAAASDGGRLSDDLPLEIQASAFERLVWEELRSIPPGSMRTYGEIAHRIGRPTAARAVARACADNQVAVLIPCHRVIAADGSLAGYRWGVERKGALLARESSAS